ncbi:hypothetical protein [Novosphingobium sp. HII-3]|uniref:hypothetical protein n=1 Tax=Novosphingobium sp. HII-3 TaxID=2075565 RepID=UPI000CDAD15A|nr:hypothetical protein [Novosphingobium sp. HII-3]
MSRQPLLQRSAAEWGVRVVLALLLAAIAFFGIARTTAYALREKDLALAHVMAPSDGRITALKAETLLQSGVTADNVRTIERFAVQALRQDPTAVAAASALGIIKQTRGDAAGAQRMLAYAERLSRRHLQTQLWAIEEAVAKGDISQALRHYDIALRTSRQAPDLLFPVLEKSIADPTVRAALVRTLAARPAWSTSFLDHIAGTAPDQAATAELYVALHRIGVEASQGAQAEVIDTLIARGNHDAAWQLYREIRPSARRDRARDPRFALLLDHPTPFDWVPVNGTGISSSIQRNNDAGLFDFVVSSGVGGVVLSQRQLLAPGVYHLKGHSIGIDLPEDARPYWALACGDGEERGNVDVPNSDQAGGFFTGQLIVPADCPVQTLMLVVRPSYKVGGGAGQIDQIELMPAR